MQREAYQNKLMELPDELHELMEEINALMAEADAITCSNPRVLDEYKKRCEEIKVCSDRRPPLLPSPPFFPLFLLLSCAFQSSFDLSLPCHLLLIPPKLNDGS